MLVDSENMEVSISVPNLVNGGILLPAPASDDQESSQRVGGGGGGPGGGNGGGRTIAQIKSERRALNRQKLLAMKRFSGFLKRPEILETVYSVEEDGDAAIHADKDATKDIEEDKGTKTR